jgi:hypothetical protein
VGLGKEGIAFAGLTRGGESRKFRLPAADASNKSAEGVKRFVGFRFGLSLRAHGIENELKKQNV